MAGLTVGARAAMLDGFTSYITTGSGTAHFTLYQRDTALAVFALDSVPFNPANLDVAVMTDVPLSSTGTEVAGTANRFVITNENGDTAYSGSVGAIGSGADIETSSLTVTAAATQTLNAFVLRMGADGSLSVEASLTLQ